VRAVAREQSREGSGSEAAEELKQRMPEALKRRCSGVLERGSTSRLSAELGLPAVQRTHRCPSGRHDRDDAVREGSVAGMERRVEYARQSRTQVARQEASEHFEDEVLRMLLLGLGQGVAPSRDGTDSAMRSAV
jgi:hypothetical protein